MYKPIMTRHAFRMMSQTNLMLKLVVYLWDLDIEERTIEDPVQRDRFRRLVEYEARLLDQLLFEDWLILFALECVHRFLFQFPTEATPSLSKSL